MYDDCDIDATFHIPELDSIEVSAEKEKVAEYNVAPVVQQVPVETSPTPIASVVQADPIQAVSTTSFVPVQYRTEPTRDDKILFQELSAVSDEVIECRNKVLDGVL